MTHPILTSRARACGELARYIRANKLTGTDEDEWIAMYIELRTWVTCFAYGMALVNAWRLWGHTARAEREANAAFLRRDVQAEIVTEAHRLTARALYGFSSGGALRHCEFGSDGELRLSERKAA